MYDASDDNCVDRTRTPEPLKTNEEPRILNTPESPPSNRLSLPLLPKLIPGGKPRADAANVLSASNVSTLEENGSLHRSQSAGDVDRGDRERTDLNLFKPSFDGSRLEHQLSVALETEPSTHREFLPRGALDQVVTQKAVDQELSKFGYLPKRLKHRPWWPATNVRIGSVEEHEKLRRSQAVLTQTTTPQSDRLCFQQVLAILLMMGRPKKIWYFVKERVSDADLPLQKVCQNGRTFELCRCDKNQSRIRCLKKQRDIKDFAARQWCVLAPFFGNPDEEKWLHHVIQKGQILPFVHWENTWRPGGSGHVHKAKVHHDHHAFNKNEVHIPRLTLVPIIKCIRYTTT
jgi:hypothetical protein